MEWERRDKEMERREVNKEMERRRKGEGGGEIRR